METPGTSGGLKELCVSTNNLQEAREKDDDPIVSIVDKDERHLLNIFPEEIWCKVLGNVDRGSLESVNNASPFFRRLLYPERQLFLFSSVWKILGVQYEVDSDPVYSNPELEAGDLNNSSDGDRVEMPKCSVILNFRLVCREWCLAINKFYEDLYHNYDTEESMLKPRVESGLDSADEFAVNREYGHEKMGQWSAFEFKYGKTIRTFMKHFEATHDAQTNPFPFRKVIFNPYGVDSNGKLNNFLTAAIPLVRKYGHHIWFCHLYIASHMTPSMDRDCYRKFQELLTLMPNLKVLQLSLQNDSFNHALLRDVMATRPIPRFDNLTFVSFVSTSGSVMENFLQNNSQVTKIEIWGLNDFNLESVALPNLTHLAVHFESMDEFDTLETCGGLWRLKMLHVTFARWQWCNVNPLPRIFACLEQWKDSLEDVVVTFPFVSHDEDKAEIVRNFRIRLDLPHVKRLRLRMNNVMSLDLILPMKNSLEILEYEPTCTNQECRWATIPKELLDEMMTEEVIQFRPAHNFNMYNSNIWTLFPKLRRIHVEEEENGGFRNGPAFIRDKVDTSKGQ